MDVEVGFVVGEEVICWACKIGMSDGVVCKCGWVCGYVLKLKIKDMYGGRGGVVEVFDSLVVKM